MCCVRIQNENYTYLICCKTHQIVPYWLQLLRSEEFGGFINVMSSIVRKNQYIKREKDRVIRLIGNIIVRSAVTRQRVYGMELNQQTVIQLNNCCCDIVASNVAVNQESEHETR